MLCGGVESNKLDQLMIVPAVSAIIRPVEEKEDYITGLDITPKAVDTTPNDSVRHIRKSRKKYGIGKNAILGNLVAESFTEIA